MATTKHSDCYLHKIHTVSSVSPWLQAQHRNREPNYHQWLELLSLHRFARTSHYSRNDERCSRSAEGRTFSPKSKISILVTMKPKERAIPRNLQSGSRCAGKGATAAMAGRGPTREKLRRGRTQPWRRRRTPVTTKPTASRPNSKPATAAWLSLPTVVAHVPRERTT